METGEEFARKIEQYFASRRVVKRDKNGEKMTDESGEYVYEEKPYTVTGLALALGFSRREDLLEVKNKTKKELIDRALLRIEESAEEKLFQKDTFNGTKLFLAVNFRRWGTLAEEDAAAAGGSGVFSLWSK